jgi:hypothetical protein
MAVIRTFSMPVESVRCQPGDYLLREEAGAGVTVHRVEDVVALLRLVPYGTDELVAEHDVLDSEPARYQGEVHLLLTAFAPVPGSLQEAASAVDAGDLVVREHGLCRDTREFPRSRTRVHRLQ